MAGLLRDVVIVIHLPRRDAAGDPASPQGRAARLRAYGTTAIARWLRERGATVAVLHDEDMPDAGDTAQLAARIDEELAETVRPVADRAAARAQRRQDELTRRLIEDGRRSIHPAP